MEIFESCTSGTKRGGELFQAESGTNNWGLLTLHLPQAIPSGGFSMARLLQLSGSQHGHVLWAWISYLSSSLD